MNDRTRDEQPRDNRVLREADMSERERQLTADAGRSNPATGDGRGINPNGAGRGLPMTDHQREHLKVLSQEAAVPLEGDLTYDEAEKRIEELQARSGHKPTPPGMP